MRLVGLTRARFIGYICPRVRGFLGAVGPSSLETGRSSLRERFNRMGLWLLTSVAIVSAFAGCGEHGHVPDASLSGMEQAQSTAAAPVPPSSGSPYPGLQVTPPPGLPTLPPSSECNFGNGLWTGDECRLSRGSTTNLPLWAPDQTVTPGWYCQEIYATGIDFKTGRPSSASGVSITYVPGSSSPCGGITGYAKVVVSPTAPVNQPNQPLYGFDNLNTVHECERFTTVCSSPVPNTGVGWSVVAVAAASPTPKPSPTPAPKPSPAPSVCDP